jgi:hypothetical protein
VSRNVVLAPVYLACTVIALWGPLDLNAAFRGGLAAFFAGRAVVSVLLFSTRRQLTDPGHLLRGYLILSYAYVAAGMLVGAGALLYGGMLGFLVAYAAFSFAWVWWWIRGSLSRTRAEQAAP